MQSRRPRFRRDRAAAPLRLTERDRSIVGLVHRHRFVRSSQIIALLGEGMQPILRRLQLLYHHGYLERPRAQIDYYHQGGSRHIVYGLGNGGAALLNQECGRTVSILRAGEKNRSVGRIFLEHALLVSDVMVALELACRKAGSVQLVRPDEIPLPAGSNSSFRWNVKMKGGAKLGIIPDRVFALESQDAAPERNPAFFFLEADRGTMPVIRASLAQTSFFRKLLAYEATWAQGLHQSQFGFHRFRVLTVTESAKRARSLAEACSRLESGHGLFLFAERSVLDDPDLLNSAIWRTGRPGDAVPLFGS